MAQDQQTGQEREANARCPLTNEELPDTCLNCAWFIKYMVEPGRPSASCAVLFMARMMVELGAAIEASGDRQPRIVVP